MYNNFESITKPYKPKSKVREIVHMVLFLLLTLVVACAFVYMTSHYAKPVHGISMQPTLNEHISDRDVVIVNKYAEPKRSDILILDVSSMDSEYTGIVDKDATLLIKRAIALPGDRIRMEYDVDIGDTRIFINGTLIQEHYVTKSESYSYYNNFVQQTHWEYKIAPVDGEIIIPDDMIFCLGDNRDNSKDCRYFGPVKLNCVKGVVENILVDGSAMNNILSWLFGF